MMNIKTLTIMLWLILVILTACAAPNGASPTPTIIRLDRSALTPTAQPKAAEASPTATVIPFPSATPSPTTLAGTTSAALTSTPAPEAQATPGPTATTPTAAAQAEIIAAGLNVREGPGVTYETSGTVAQGDKLNISGVSANGNWLQIVTATGKSGWISSQPAYVRILGSLDDVPVVEGSPTSSIPVSGQAAAAGGQSPVLSQLNGSVVASGGQIIFATRSGGDLYAINTDGTALRKLTAGVIDPVVSPDGQRVAYTRWDGANMGTVYILNLSDGSEQVVASDIPRPKSPTWSQDGQAIIISFQHGGVVNPKPECRNFDSDDGRQLPNTSEIVSVHRSSNGGFTICFIRREDLQWGLRQINLATGKSDDLPADLYSFNPIWDPRNGSRVLYDGLRGLMQLDLSSGKLQPFTDDVRDTAPVFSPDGQKLAMTYKQHDHWEVYTYDMVTGSRQRLTKPPLLADPQYNSAAPAWSPDGSQIIFMTDRTGQWEIWVMNADGSNPHALLSTEAQAQLGLSYQGVNERLFNWIASSAPVPAGSTSAAPVVTPNAVAGQSNGAAAETSVSLNGTWDFSFGSMSLTQQNSRIEGTYQWYGGGDTGKIQGIVVAELNQFQGLWVSDRSPNSQKLLHWQLATNGAGFAGTSEGSSTSQQWCGVRSGQPLPAGCGFSGVWQLHFGNPPGVTGQATLVQTGQTVQGTYVDSQGHTGKIVDGLITVQSTTEVWLKGTWRNDQGEQDSFEWRLDLTTGRTFQGRRNPGNSEWCGWRSGASEPDPCGWKG